jgi:hypothetical protein
MYSADRSDTTRSITAWYLPMIDALQYELPNPRPAEIHALVRVRKFWSV